MTTTGGPDQSFADPAINEHADDPVVLDRDAARLDGDDITVEADHAPVHPRRRARAALVGAVVIVLVAAGIAVALASRRTSSPTKVSSLTPVRPPAARPTPANKAVTATPKPPRHPVAAPKHVAPSVGPKRPANIATPPSFVSPPATPVAQTPPPPPPVTAPPAEPPSVLQWQSTPGTVSIKAGASASFTVNVVNPTNGTVTLGNPLSCAPVLRGLHGATFESGVCVEMAQLMAPHQHLTHRYTIWATDSADATGKALAPGSYTVRVENLFTVKVNITAS